MSELLAPWPGTRFPPGDAGALALALDAQLDAPFLPPVPVPDWDVLAQRTLGLCTQALAAPR
jgi:hypothetical protein